MPNPNVNPNPKYRFQESSQNISKHRDLIQMPEFQRAIDFALLEYQSRLSSMNVDNFNNAAANHLKVTGAIEFVHQLKYLAEQTAPTPKIVDRDNLSQNQ